MTHDEGVEVGLEVKEEALKFKNPLKTSGQAVVVLGEASESDDDDEILTDNSSNCKIVVAKPQSPVVSRTVPKTRQSFAHNSLLHKKLRERNAAMRDHIIQGAKQPYQTAAKDLGATSQQLVKSQNLVQEVSTILRQSTNNVFHLEDKLDIAIDCGRLVPSINIRIPAKAPVE